MDLSAVIVNWNSASYLARLTQSLIPLSAELREIVVVDNASDDSSFEVVKNRPEICLVCFDRNQGFARAANEGISRTSSAFTLLLNPDVEVKPQSIRHLYDRIVERPQAAIVCGPLVDGDGRAQSFQIRSFPSWRSILADVLFLDELAQWLPGSSPACHHLRRGHGSVSATNSGVEVEQPAAAFWVLRKRAWESIGGFDPQFFPAWFEDVDFCKRLHGAAWQVVYFPDFPVIHLGGLAVERLGYPAFVEMYYGNLLKYLKKHHRYSYPFLWFPVRWGTWVRKQFARR